MQHKKCKEFSSFPEPTSREEAQKCAEVSQLACARGRWCNGADAMVLRGQKWSVYRAYGVVGVLQG